METKCNIVLSGGGVRGYAHVGALKALYEKEVLPAAISGTSSGALIGAFICDGFHPKEIEEIIIRHNPRIGFNYARFWNSLLSFNSFTEILKKNLRSVKFENLKIPLFVSVTNLTSGLQEIIQKGDLVEALTASAAIPVLFPTPFINGIPYGDGGITNNLPVNPFIGSSLKVIGVHVNPLTDFVENSSMLQNIDRSMHLLMRNSVIVEKHRCDVFIEPSALKQFHLFDHKRANDIVKIGYQCVMEETDLSPLYVL